MRGGAKRRCNPTLSSRPMGCSGWSTATLRSISGTSHGPCSHSPAGFVTSRDDHLGTIILVRIKQSGLPISSSLGMITPIRIKQSGLQETDVASRGHILSSGTWTSATARAVSATCGSISTRTTAALAPPRAAALAAGSTTAAARAAGGSAARRTTATRLVEWKAKFPWQSTCGRT
jgi:hypothetical protein